MARTTLDIDAVERLAGELAALARLARRLGPVLEAAALPFSYPDIHKGTGDGVSAGSGTPANRVSPVLAAGSYGAVGPQERDLLAGGPTSGASLRRLPAPAWRGLRGQSGAPRLAAARPSGLSRAARNGCSARSVAGRGRQWRGGGSGWRPRRPRSWHRLNATVFHHG